jgi:PTH2 family peptidyl-tRNA hydrolase
MKKKKEEIKQVIIWRSDIKSPKGKVASQVAHASMLFLIRGTTFGWSRDFLKKTIENSIYSENEVEKIKTWIEEGMTKVCLKAENIEAMGEIAKKAKELGVITNFVVDSGRTVYGESTITCLALGPEISSVLDTITGDLKLL